MRLLLDTHTFLWLVTDDPRISVRAHRILENLENEALLSIASLWEIAIKASLGKLVLVKPFAELITEQVRLNEIALLGIEIDHLASMVALFLASAEVRGLVGAIATSLAPARSLTWSTRCQE